MGWSLGSASSERSIGVHIRASLDDDHDGCGCMIRRGYVNIDILEPWHALLRALRERGTWFQCWCCSGAFQNGTTNADDWALRPFVRLS